MAKAKEKINIFKRFSNWLNEDDKTNKKQPDLKKLVFTNNEDEEIQENKESASRNFSSLEVHPETDFEQFDDFKQQEENAKSDNISPVFFGGMQFEQELYEKQEKRLLNTKPAKKESKWFKKLASKPSSKKTSIPNTPAVSLVLPTKESISKEVLQSLSNASSLAFFINEYNKNIFANLPVSYNITQYFDIAKIHEILIKEFNSYNKIHKSALYKEAQAVHPIATISTDSALSFFDLDVLYSNYDWNYLKNNLFNNFANLKPVEEENTTSLWIHTKDHKEANLNFFNAQKNEIVKEVLKSLKQKDNKESTNPLKTDSISSISLQKHHFLDNYTEPFEENRIEKEKDDKPKNIIETEEEQKSYYQTTSYALPHRLPIFLYKNVTKDNLFALDFIFNKVIILNYVEDLLADNQTNYNIVSLDIYKQNLIKQIVLNPYAKEWKVFNLFHSIYPLKAKQLTFSFFDFENALNYYDLHFEDLIVYCNLYFTNAVPASLFVDINDVNVNNELLKNLPNHLKQEAILASQPNILKQSIYLKNQETNLKQLIIPQGSVLPVNTKLVLLPVHTTGKFAFNILLGLDAVFSVDLNLNDVDFMMDDKIYVELTITEEKASLQVKYAFNNANSEPNKLGNNKEQTTYNVLNLVNEYPFLATINDRTHFNYLNILNIFKEFEIKNMELYAKELLKKPFVFNDLLNASITVGDKLFEQDLINSFAYLIAYNHIHKEDKLDLQRLTSQKDKDWFNKPLTFYQNTRSFSNSYFTNNYDLQYLTQGMDIADALRITKKHRLAIWLQRLKLKR